MAVLSLICGLAAIAQPQHLSVSALPSGGSSVSLTVVDQNGVLVPSAEVTIQEAGLPDLRTMTDYDGRASWLIHQSQPYSLRVEKQGFYQTTQSDIDPQGKTIRVVLTHQEVLQQEVNVHASTAVIDTEQTSNQLTLAVPEVINVPFPTNRDIRNLLPFIPSVVPDEYGQVHVAGGATYMTLDTLDGFDIRSPISGNLSLHFSTDAVRSVDTETTRYPVEYGRSTGGVIAFTTGTGDNKFRYDATNFVPSVRNLNGLRFDAFEPRITFSGPIRRNRLWFFDAIDMRCSDTYIPELPTNADTNHLIEGSNLIKFQQNLGSRNTLTANLLWNDFHSPYDGLSALNPQQSTDNHDIIAWLPYLQEQHSFPNNILVTTGFGVLRYREGFEPHGDLPYDVTPELPTGSNFETSTTRSQREEGYVNLFFPPIQHGGSHELRAGIDLDHLGSREAQTFAPINYLSEARTLLRRSVFPSFAPFRLHNVELGAYGEDRWTPVKGLLIVPGLRFDWDEIIRGPLWSPRIAMNYSPHIGQGKTTFSAGIGEYNEHTQLEYLARAYAGTRYDTLYAADGTTPLGLPIQTTFVQNEDTGNLHEAHAINWSIGIQHMLPHEIYFAANYMQKRVADEFVYANQSGPGALYGTYLLTSDRQDHFHSWEIEARHTFAGGPDTPFGGSTLFGAYTRSSATTNAALDYVPSLSILGPQQPGPLPWDTPNRVISWGWLPAWAPWLPTVHKNWDFVYTLLWDTGFPFDSVNANQQIIGPAGSHRFPSFLSLSPGLEWRFHFRGKYFGIRGLLENATDASDPYIVNNNVDSPQYLNFEQPLGRAFTTRIRLIQSSK
ncbi:MAG TPA: carboxypeptidase regulatory-like domain-containing protein [Acidobacteriaceae bacterium]|nr:carboxypeptidase regulatory-like domain-containing protein [Acidobacteriaceae bacterium]